VRCPSPSFLSLFARRSVLEKGRNRAVDYGAERIGTIASESIGLASPRRLAIALIIGLLGCAGDDTSPGGAGGAGVSSGGAPGTGGSSGSAGRAGAGGAPAGGSGGGGGSSGVSGSAGRGGTAGLDGSAGTGGGAGSGGSAGKGGAGGAAGVDGGAGTGGAAGSGKAGASGAGGVAGGDGAAGAGGTAGSQTDGGASIDASRDVAREASDASDAGGDGGAVGPAAFHCVNWADPRDNFVNGNLELSGLSAATDTYATVQSKANDILGEFQTKLKADSIRIPINEPTVSGTWWNAYKGVIDTAIAKGMKVVIAYWAYQNGRPADAAAFRTMWQVVVSAYQSSNLVYFDIHNEPYGYSGSAWNDAAAAWLADFPNVPRGRVIVAGTGYDDNVNSVGADPRFAGCILELHIYGFWHTDWTTQRQWHDSMTSALGPYASRTLVGEWGAPMTTGMDYGVMMDGDAYRSYVLAVSNLMHDNVMGSCYWPGLRNADSYSMTKLNSGASPLTLTVTNASGLARLHWAWRVP
jgi:hypothetical protein